jgi:RimJ/RimL family protein N-acetyltransferase
MIDLAPVTEARLPLLVAAALAGAAADDVTPPVSPGPEWTGERVEWLRAFHRDRREGLAGPRQESTWAVVDVGDDAGPEDGRVVGGVRLQRTDDPSVLETGIWLVRDARSRGVGRQSLQLVLERARYAGAATVRADTTVGNAAALGVLRSLGAVVTVDGEVVRAEIPLWTPDPGPR